MLLRGHRPAIEKGAERAASWLQLGPAAGLCPLSHRTGGRWLKLSLPALPRATQTPEHTPLSVATAAATVAAPRVT